MARGVDAIIDEAIAESAHPLPGGSDDYEPLFRLIGSARFVLLGEATHGTHDFYAERARITRALIERFGFSAVAVEADWPDAYRVNRYVRGLTADRNGRDALGAFARFPTWMWRNSNRRSSNGFGRSTTNCAATKLVSTASISTASTHRSTRCWVICSRPTRKRPGSHESVTPASTTSTATASATRTRRDSARGPAKTTSSRNWPRCCEATPQRSSPTAADASDANGRDRRMDARPARA